jgi:hypothetical protein
LVVFQIVLNFSVISQEDKQIRSEATRKRVIMSTPSDDGPDSELNKYAPKWSRERPATPDAERPRLVNTASTVPSLREEYQDRRIRSLRPEPVPEPPPQRDGLLARIGQITLVAVVAAVVALLVVFGKSLLEGVSPLNSGSQTRTYLKIARGSRSAINVG